MLSLYFYQHSWTPPGNAPAFCSVPVPWRRSEEVGLMQVQEFRHPNPGFFICSLEDFLHLTGNTFLLVKTGVWSRIEARAFVFVLHPSSAGKNRRLIKNGSGNIEERDQKYVNVR